MFRSTSVVTDPGRDKRGRQETSEGDVAVTSEGGLEQEGGCGQVRGTNARQALRRRCQDWGVRTVRCRIQGWPELPKEGASGRKSCPLLGWRPGEQFWGTDRVCAAMSH